MESALVVTAAEKTVAHFSELLNAASISQIVALPTCGEARRLLLEQDFDLVIINTPLRDESGEVFAQQIAAKGVSQVILVVPSEFFDAISEICESDGVLTIARPLNRAVFWAILQLAKSAHNRIARVNKENAQLKQRIEDIRIVDRAKCLLISYLKMSEQDAHRFIEKQAMDMRVSKRMIAEGILKMYES